MFHNPTKPVIRNRVIQTNVSAPISSFQRLGTCNGPIEPLASSTPFCGLETYLIVGYLQTRAHTVLLIVIKYKK